MILMYNDEYDTFSLLFLCPWIMYMVMDVEGFVWFQSLHNFNQKLTQSYFLDFGTCNETLLQRARASVLLYCVM